MDIGGLPGPLEAILVLAMGIFFVVAYVLPFWRIYQRLGFSPWLSMLMVITPLNIILLYYLAFAEWPAMREPTRPSRLQ